MPGGLMLLFDLRWTRAVVSFALTMALVGAALLAGMSPAEAYTDAANRVSFSRIAGSAWQIHTALPDGRDSRQLTSSAGNKCDPAMSPDGSQIAYVTGDTLRVVPAAGGAEKDVAVHQLEYVRSPTWSPDGSAIVYMGSIAYNGGAATAWTTQLFRVTRLADGSWSQPEQLTNVEGGMASPRYSPDGTRIAFSYLADWSVMSERDLFIAAVGGGGELGEWVRVTSVGGAEQTPTWNPNGTHLMYTSCGGGVWTVHVSSGERTRIGKVTACSAVWSSTDARQAVIETGSSLAVVTLANGRTAKLTPRRAEDRQPDW